MKRILFFIFIALSSAISFAQTETVEENCSQSECVGNYQLFPTKNMWIFLKLDTRTGEIWMVQYSVEKGKERCEVVLNSKPFAVFEKEKKVGRFTLYPTENTYNFILLDKIDGRCWQVQWAFKEEDRGVLRIN